MCHLHLHNLDRDNYSYKYVAILQDLSRGYPGLRPVMSWIPSLLSVIFLVRQPPPEPQPLFLPCSVNLYSLEAITPCQNVFSQTYLNHRPLIELHSPHWPMNHQHDFWVSPWHDQCLLPVTEFLVPYCASSHSSGTEFPRESTHVSCCYYDSLRSDALCQKSQTNRVDLFSMHDWLPDQILQRLIPRCLCLTVIYLFFCDSLFIDHDRK